MGRLQRSAAGLVLLVLDGSPVFARTWHIRPDGSGDAPTVRAGLDSAAAGDDVLLAPGTYSWTSEQASGFALLTIAKPNITLHSEAGASMTILDAEGRWRVLRCIDVGSVVIEGLTLQHGFSHLEIRAKNQAPQTHGSDGGAIYATGNSHLTVRRCVFRNNGAGASGGNDAGGAIVCDLATIEECEFLDNSAGDVTSSGEGGAIRCGAAQIERCNFRGNRAVGHTSAGGGAISHAGATIRSCSFNSNLAGAAHGGGFGGAVAGFQGGAIESCQFADNRSGGIGGAVAQVGGSVEDCVFVRNVARSGGGAYVNQSIVSGCVFISNEATNQPPGSGGRGGGLLGGGSFVDRSTFVSNSGGTSDGVGGIEMDGGSVRNVIVAYSVGLACRGTATWSCSDVFGNQGGDAVCSMDAAGNFSADPQFCAADPVTSLNVTLQADSPCAPGNHPNGVACGLIGARPVGCGAVAVELHTWGDVKVMYR